MIDKVFVDSNIWVYIFAGDEPEKRDIAKQFIEDIAEKNTLIISFQVLNEVTNVLKRKKLTEAAIRQVIESLSKICVIQDYTKDVALSASTLREKHSFSFWDSLIVSSALAARCDVLASEDMQNSRTIDNMIIKNIFV